MFLLKLVLLLFGCVLCFVRSFLYFSFCLHEKNKHNNASEDKEHQPHSSIDDNNKKHDNTSKDTFPDMLMLSFCEFIAVFFFMVLFCHSYYVFMFVVVLLLVGDTVAPPPRAGSGGKRRGRGSPPPPRRRHRCRAAAERILCLLLYLL